MPVVASALPLCRQSLSASANSCRIAPVTSEKLLFRSVNKRLASLLLNPPGKTAHIALHVDVPARIQPQHLL
jgi:hypothetical protein